MRQKCIQGEKERERETVRNGDREWKEERQRGRKDKE